MNILYTVYIYIYFGVSAWRRRAWWWRGVWSWWWPRRPTWTGGTSTGTSPSPPVRTQSYPVTRAEDPDPATFLNADPDPYLKTLKKIPYE